MGLWSQVFIALPIVWAAVFAFIIFGMNLFQQTIGIGVAVDWTAALVMAGLYSRWRHFWLMDSYHHHPKR